MARHGSGMMARMRRLVGRSIRAIPWLRRWWEASTDYQLISEAEARDGTAQGWLSPVTAWRQEHAYLALLAAMRAGAPRIDLAIAATAIDALELDEVSLLEIGCGSGYYSEVLARLPATKVAYTGIDYSPVMVARARRRYPHGRFEKMDATNLAFDDGSFDIAFNGVSLMHIPEWRKAVQESRRVSRRACIFHSVPVFPSRGTAHIRKYAYGAPVVEIVFNRAELLACFGENGLKVEQSWTGLPYDVAAVAGQHSFAETFLCVPQAGP
jgi:ubiquinone/menaquinone biosynthesis C-methylase UbiE